MKGVMPAPRFTEGLPVSVPDMHLMSNNKIPYGNRLETIKGKRQGQCSIRINDQWRML